MPVDSYRYLPHSFVPMYKNLTIPPTDEVWAAPSKPPTESVFALLTSGGLFLRNLQEPFDVEREHRDPTWGDPGVRLIPSDVAPSDIDASHLHYNTDLVREDFNVALPIRAFKRLAALGSIGTVSPIHFSVMGYQEQGTRVWSVETGPQIAAKCHDVAVDVLVLAPS